jgi:integrase
MIHSNIYAIKTLNDVRLLLPALYSEASCKVYTAALTKVTRLTGKPLTHVLADEHTWFLFAQTIVWAGAFRGATPGDQKRAFDAWVKKIAASIKRAQNHVASPVLPAPKDAAWERLEAYTKDVENTFDTYGVRVLPNMFSLSIANLRAQCGETHPALLDTDVVSKAIVACRADKSPSLRRSVSAFNKLIRNQNRHPVICDLLPPIPIGPLPALRDLPLDWSCFSAAFLRSRDRAIQRAIHPDRKRSDPFGGKLGKDPLEGRRRDGQKRKRKVRNPDAARKRHLNALSWLIRHAYPDRSLAYTLNGIEALLTVEIVEQGVDRYVARAEASKTLKDPDKTSSGNSILSSLETLARRNDLPEDVIWAIEDARYDRVDSYQAREMSLEREAFVKLVERDAGVARAIVSGPRRLMMEASQAFDRWETLGVRARGEALHLSLGSTLMALQLARAVRSKNLNEMTTDGDDAELIRPLRQSKPWIDIARSKVKNRRPIEGEIPDRQWHIIMSWLDDGLPRWCDLHGLDIERNIHLVPGPNGILSRQSFNRIWNRCVERLGIPGLQPHMMRHVAATLWLAANPGDYATVAAFLGDSVKTVEKFYARGEGAAAAKLFAQVLENIDPTLNAFLSRSNP